jgi:pimeloyl-ACP methyl ester carboxylesterase
MINTTIRFARRALLAMTLCLASGAVASAADAESISGTLADGTRWEMSKPADWNGTIILDLDGAAGARSDPYRDWLLTQGFATGGTQREPVGYDFVKAVENLVAVREQFITRWGKPKRTIASGGSRGGFVTRIAVERRPDIFAGGLVVAGGGGGQIAGQRDKLNAVFALKTLVDPQAPLRLVNIDNVQAETAALGDLVKKANASPQGRARLALAASFEQFALWTSRNKPRPGATDYDAQVDQIAENFAFANPASVRAGVEKIAGGNVSWNTDVDYADLLQRSGRAAMVEAMYSKAGLDLAADLAALAKAPRIKADPAAVAKEEPLGSYTGKIQGPVVNVDNDDPVDAAPYKLEYLNTLKRAGTDNLFRMLWTDTAGHASIPAVDKAVGFTLLLRRLDTGAWGDTSLPALQALAAGIVRQAPALGQSKLFDPGPITPALFSWDASKWGSYKGR